MLKKVKITSMDLLAELMSKPLGEGKTVKFTVVGSSMYPLLRNGVDNVFLSSKTTPGKYDVILYRRKDGSYVLHRIVGVKKDGFVLCGGNQLKTESPVISKDVVAVMTAFERNGREIPKNKLWYRLYSVLWSRLIFARRPLFKVCHKIKMLFKIRLK